MGAKKSGADARGGSNQMRAWLDPKWRHQLSNSVITWVAIGALSLAGTVLVWLWNRSPQRWVEMSCRPEAVPSKTLEDPVFGVLLHPKWGNQIQTVVNVGFTANGLPSKAFVPPPPGVGYRCVISNDADYSLYSVILPLEVAFENKSASIPRRSIRLTLPEAIPSKKTFVLHIADDTGWNPEVILPERITAKVGDDAEAQDIRVRHSSADGKPIRLRGFVPRPSS
jgi:hypothetical protein